MTLFALLHGGMHNGDCWQAVQAGLRGHGHQSVAPDLPSDDDAAGAQQWAQVAVDAINEAVGPYDTDVVVVGHSIAGLCVPVVAELRALRRMVFVGGLLPVPGQSFVDHLAENADAITFPQPQTDGTGPFGLTWDSVHRGFYHDCPEGTAQQAFKDMRMQSFTVFVETCPIAVWPQTPSTYVLMRDDRAVGRQWARRNAVDRGGAQLVEMRGGHSPFFSRPSELCDALVAAASA